MNPSNTYPIARTKMRSSLFLVLCASALVVPLHAASPAPSTYAGQQTRDIKALSAEDVTSILEGNGMGFAKAAELNGYPGPAHVLELSSELGLSRAQKEKSAALFASMQAKAVALGGALVAEERRLDEAFAGRTVSRGSLLPMVAKIGELQAQLRAAHLEAHLEQIRILTPRQVAEYARLRGYAAGGDAAAEHGAHHH